MGGFPERIGGSDYLLPWANPKDKRVIKRPMVPLGTAIAYFRPRYSANAASKASAAGPVEILGDRNTASTASARQS